MIQFGKEHLMKPYLLGVLATLLLLVFVAFLYLKLGYLDMRADVGPSSLESRWAMTFLDASVDRRAPERSSPVEARESNLIEGIRLYKTNCALCHGAPGHPEKSFGHPFYPPAPQFMEEAPDMPENQNYYIIKHGIRWTGMPAWGNVLSDQQIWTLITFLSHMEKLPPSVQQEWQKAPVSSQGVMNGMPVHGGAK
jgi:mono/diheme cytochrome c family protein